MRNFTLAIVCLLSTWLCAQTIEEKSLLWEISKGDNSPKSYLFGTMHVMCKGDVVLSETALNAIKNSDKIVLELDMDDPAIMTQMMTLSFAKDGKTISSQLTPETIEKLNQYLQEKANLSVMLVDNLNLVSLYTQLGIFALGCPLDLGYEMLLVQQAKMQGKEVLGLESLEEQIKVLFDMNDEDAIKGIEYIVNNSKEVTDYMDQMRNLYINQEVQQLYDFMMKAFDDPKFPQGNKNTMLDDRNKNWIPVIENITQNNTAFFGVGAAHLAGENGVINLLRKKGYTVKALK